MKQRLSHFDLQIITNELQSQILDFRLQKIYDITANNHTFLFRFQKPGIPPRILLINPGFQIHLTDFTWPMPDSPSGFVTKLRKHLLNRRLLKISLAKNDRILVFTFPEYYVVFEFFSGGNLLLLDEGHKIIALQKRVNILAQGNNDNTSKKDQQQFPTSHYAVGNVYDIKGIISQEPVSNDDDKPESVSEEDIFNWIEEKKNESSQASQGPPSQEGHKKKKSKAVPLKSALYVKFPQLSSSLFENVLLKNEMDPNLTMEKIDTEDKKFITKLTESVNEAFQEAFGISHSDKVAGYIVAKKNPDFAGESTLSGDLIVNPVPLTSEGGLVDPHKIELLYNDFQPFQPLLNSKASSNDVKLIKLDNYNRTVDIFYSTLEASKISLKVLQQEKIAERRLAHAREEKEKRLKGLTEIQDKNNLMGRAIESHVDLVDRAVEVIKGFLKKKMDWQDIEQLIKVEKSRNDPIAKVIGLPLKLKENKITLILPNPDEVVEEEDEESSSSSDSSDSESDSESDGEGRTNKRQKPQKTIHRPVKVDVDLTLTAWANARYYYEIKRDAAAKGERTLMNADKAYKSAEKKILRDLQQTQAKNLNTQQGGGLRSIRQTFWFEKFYWFISSDGYLVLGGRDDAQNNLLFRRYFKKDDIFVHCDQPGASILIIKNHYGASDIPPATLSQSGAFSVASSTKAWESKIMNAPAWWARFEQIDKISAQGEPIDVSSITVKGEKNVIRTSSMDMGLGFMWVLDDEGTKRRQAEQPDSGAKGAQTSVTKDESAISNIDGINGADVLEKESTAHSNDEKSDSDSEDSDSDSDDDLFANVKVNEAVIKGKVKLVVNKADKRLTSSQPLPTSFSDAEKSKNGTKDEDSEKSVIAENKDLEGIGLESNEKSSKAGSDGKITNSGVSQNLEEVVTEKLARAKQPRTTYSSGGSTPSGGEFATLQSPVLTRGKRNKLKKAATKYGDQDEEDRARMMAKLGTLRGLEKAREAEQETIEKQKQQEQLKRERAKRAKEAELRKILAQDESEGASEGGTQQFPFSQVVPALKRGETPVAAVPVFGPWQALQRVKFKVKIQQGSVKKGKAVKDILHHIAGITRVDSTNQDVDLPWPLEINLIKAVKETEAMMPVAVSKVKFTLPRDSSSTSSGAAGGKGGDRSGAGKKGRSGGKKKR